MAPNSSKAGRRRALRCLRLGVVLWELLAGRRTKRSKMRLVTDYNSDVSEDLALA